MQKLRVRFQNTPWDALLIPSSVSPCLNSSVRVGTVMRTKYRLDNNSEVDLPVSCGSGTDGESPIRWKNHTLPIPPPIEMGGFLGGII